MKTIKFIMQMPPDLNKKIEDFAKPKEISKSSVVKMAVAKFLEQEKNEEPKLKEVLLEIASQLKEIKRRIA